MKPINVYFEDSEMEALKKVKGDMTWHDFIIDCARSEKYVSVDLRKSRVQSLNREEREMTCK